MALAQECCKLLGKPQKPIFQAGPRGQSLRGTMSSMCCHVLGFLLRAENEELSLGSVSPELIHVQAEGIISSLAEQAMSKKGGESKWGLVTVQLARAGSPQSSGCWKKQGRGQGNTPGFHAKSMLGVSLKVSSTQQLLFHFTSSSKQLRSLGSGKSSRFGSIKPGQFPAAASTSLLLDPCECAQAHSG